MLNYLDLPIYDRELIYSFIQGQYYFEIRSEHEKKFKPVLDWIKKPTYLSNNINNYSGGYRSNHFYLERTGNLIIIDSTLGNDGNYYPNNITHRKYHVFGDKVKQPFKTFTSGYYHLDKMKFIGDFKLF